MSTAKKPGQKKIYQTPRMTQWGSVRELTHGIALDNQDGFGTGTRGT